MGYTTDFEGQLKITPVLTGKDRKWLKNFSEKRHQEIPFGGKYPGIWCDWEPTKGGKYLVWNNSEKFYKYIEWLKYLIEEFFDPKGYKLNGVVKWWGEERGDIGKIIVKNNEVEVKKAKITF